MLAAKSIYRDPYNPSLTDHNHTHLILCGHVTDWRRVERLLRELFHPIRHSGSYPEFNVVILAPSEPTEGMKALLLTSRFDSCTSYIIGSALSGDDLVRARADIATSVLFLCNAELSASKEQGKLDDIATVLNTLSVNNFNSNLTLLIQVVKREDKELLKDGFGFHKFLLFYLILL